MQADTNKNMNSVLTVCLVDDDPTIRTLFSRVIQRAGYNVITAGGLSEAQKSLAEHPVHVVISDLRMPEACDGERLLRFVKLHFPNLPIFMMSGDWTPDTQARLMASGANDCIIKPFTTESFSRLIENQDMDLHSTDNGN